MFNEIDTDNEVPYFAQIVLRQRGWTLKAIKRFLGDPDQLQPNPHHEDAAPMRLFKASRVIAAENTPEFVAWYQERRRRASQGMWA